MTSGQYLPENYDSLSPDSAFVKGGEFPVLATAASGIGESSVTQVRELAAPSAPPALDLGTMSKDVAQAGHPVLSTTITARQAYQYLLQMLGGSLHQHLTNALSVYWSAGPVSYQRASNGDLVPAAARNPPSVWASGAGFVSLPWTTPTASTGRCGSTHCSPPRGRPI